jgi:hypothetical protein
MRHSIADATAGRQVVLRRQSRSCGGRFYELAHIVGISKIAYVLATPRCLKWRRDL